MAESDSDALLLDKIGGTYGEGSDEDLGNTDEDALLEEDADFIGRKHFTLYDENEELDHEPEEPDIEDVLDLEAQDVELEDDVEEKNNLNLSNVESVSSTTQLDVDVCSTRRRGSHRESERAVDKFKNERQKPLTKKYDIPDSLDRVTVSNITRSSQSIQRNFGQSRGTNIKWGGNQREYRNRPDNKTVLINPHFKGHVKINNDARLAWDACQKINCNIPQGRMGSFTPKQNFTARHIMEPLVNNTESMAHCVPQYPTPFQQFYRPPIPPVHQMSTWNQYQATWFDQVPQGTNVGNNQQTFNQSMPQNTFPNQHPLQFTQPPHPHFNSTPIYPNSNPNPHLQNQVFTNPQYIHPSNQYHQPIESYYRQNQYMHPSSLLPPSNVGYNRPPFIAPNRGLNRQFRNQQQGIERRNVNINFGKTRFDLKGRLSNKRKGDNTELRKKKRVLPSKNLQEVRTIDAPDTTIMVEEKPQGSDDDDDDDDNDDGDDDDDNDDDDEETKAYRLKIEEQKRKREEIFKLKEQRRLQAIQRENPTMHFTTCKTNNRKRQTNLKLASSSDSLKIQENVNHTSGQNTQNNIKISTITDEFNHDRQHLASFLSNRKILAKDETLPDTSIVVVSNLAAGTTDIKLRKMCQGIGDVKKLQMSFKERQATIQFNSVASAHAFFKKYRRTMLDLSMIQVVLNPTT